MLMASVSFFNELATEKRNYACGCFLIMASRRITEILCRHPRKGIDSENLTEAAHKHPTNIMTYFKTQGRHTYAWVIKT
jgi:AraC-like DNA-binding protein